MTVAFSGAYAADDMKKGETGATKSEKGMAKKDDKSKAGMKGDVAQGDAMKDDKAMKGDKAVKGDQAVKGDKGMAKGKSEDKMTK
jgi:hypothetical protein